jgi:hypothetical protein
MCVHLNSRGEFDARHKMRSRTRALSPQIKDEERGPQGQPDNREESWKPKCIVMSPLKDRIRVKRPGGDDDAYLETRTCNGVLFLFVRFSDLEGEQSVRVVADVHIGSLSTTLLVIPDYGFRLFMR